MGTGFGIFVLGWLMGVGCAVGVGWVWITAPRDEQMSAWRDAMDELGGKDGEWDD